MFCYQKHIKNIISNRPYKVILKDVFLLIGTSNKMYILKQSQNIWEEFTTTSGALLQRTLNVRIMTKHNDNDGLMQERHNSIATHWIYVFFALTHQ